MRLLLDTHALLWAWTEPARLSDRARTAIADGGNQLLISSASAWEISTKHRLGKLPAAGELLLTFSDHARRLGADDLPVTHRHALLAGALNWAHRDPFDRMLAAQAMLETVPLVTCDGVFANLPGITCFW